MSLLWIMPILQLMPATISMVNVQYIEKYLLNPPGRWAKHVETLDIGDAEIERVVTDMVGFSGCAISRKLAIAWQAAAYGTDGAILDQTASPRFKDARAVKSRRAYDKGTSTAMATPEAITFPEGLASTTTHPAKRQQRAPTSTCGAATKKAVVYAGVAVRRCELGYRRWCWWSASAANSPWWWGWYYACFVVYFYGTLSLCQN
eukprot:scaffold50167_cov51-Attheya_sp.AAC.3